MTEGEWSLLLGRFADASIYQTWAYEKAVHPQVKVSRIVIYENDEPVALVQAGLVTIPFVGTGLAYIRWGPVWRLKNSEADPARLQSCLRALVDEYAIRRRFLVRIVTGLNSMDEGWAIRLFQETGFKLQTQLRPAKTIIVDLSPSLEEIQAGLHGKWRNCLNSGRKKEHELRVGQDDADFAEFSRIYQAMRARKRFETTTSFEAFRKLQNELAEREKMTVILCGIRGCWHSGAVISAVGERGIYLFGATAEEGLTSNGSYLVQWQAIQWLKEMGCREYDLNGVNAEENPTTYHFKSRLAGRNGREVAGLGTFDACTSTTRRATVAFGRGSVQVMRRLRRLWTRMWPTSLLQSDCPVRNERVGRDS